MAACSCIVCSIHNELAGSCALFIPILGQLCLFNVAVGLLFSVVFLDGWLALQRRQSTLPRHVHLCRPPAVEPHPPSFLQPLSIYSIVKPIISGIIHASVAVFAIASQSAVHLDWLEELPARHHRVSATCSEGTAQVRLSRGRLVDNCVATQHHPSFRAIPSTLSLPLVLAVSAGRLSCLGLRLRFLLHSSPISFTTPCKEVRLRQHLDNSSLHYSITRRSVEGIVS